NPRARARRNPSPRRRWCSAEPVSPRPERNSTLAEFVLSSRRSFSSLTSLPVREFDLMALSSMTGFARSHGASGPYTFEWELKSVNAKDFDLRVRLPQGFEELEAHAKKRAGEVLSRGTVYANLTVKRTNAAATVRVNEDVLNAVLK